MASTDNNPRMDEYMELRINELFYSIQGEGVFAGVPSVFVRLAGCNLRCAWCDTSYALDGVESIAFDPQSLLELFAKNGWYAKLGPESHVQLVFTGGEPMLQQEGILYQMKAFENMRDQNDIPQLPYTAIETNGTVPIRQPEITKYITTAALSPKLENSGLPESQRYRPDVLKQYMEEFDYFFKFVIYSEEDMKEIVLNYLVKLEIDNSLIWLMPAGRTRQEIYSRATNIVELAKDYRFNYSPRLQVDLWEDERGV